MADKGIGFSRTVYHRWLDATAVLRMQEQDTATIRAQLDGMLTADLSGQDARRKTIDVLLGFWDKSSQASPELHGAALRLYRDAYTSDDYLWLHYGLGLLYYSIFRSVTAVIGQLARIDEHVTRAEVKSQVISNVGHLGAIDRSVERICASLTEWGLFLEAEQRFTYRPALRVLRTENAALQSWLLACALHAHPSGALIFSDLLRLPELFPFDLTPVGVAQVLQAGWFEVTREGGWDMVRLR